MSKIIEITIGLATSFNNPFESFSNFKPSVQLKAIVADGEDPNRVAIDLQAKVGDLLATERHRILDGLKREHEIENAKRNVDWKKERVDALERVISENPVKLADAEWRSTATQFAVERMENQLKNASDELPGVRAELAEAETKLAGLIGM